MFKKTNKKVLPFLLFLAPVIMLIVTMFLGMTNLNAADSPETAPSKYFVRTISNACDSGNYDSFKQQIANSGSSFVGGTNNTVLIKATRVNGVLCPTDTFYIYKDFYLQSVRLKTALPQQLAAWKIIIKHLNDIGNVSDNDKRLADIDFIQKQIDICSAASFFDTAYKNYFIIPDGPALADKLKPLMNTPTGIVFKKSDTEILALKSVNTQKLTTAEQNTFYDTDGRLAWQTLANIYSGLVTSLTTCVYPADATVAKNSQQSIVTHFKDVLATCSPFIYEDPATQSGPIKKFMINSSKSFKLVSDNVFPDINKTNSTFFLPQSLDKTFLKNDAQITSFFKYSADWDEIIKLYTTIRDKANMCGTVGDAESIKKVKDEYSKADLTIAFITEQRKLNVNYRTRVEGVYTTYSDKKFFYIDKATTGEITKELQSSFSNAGIADYFSFEEGDPNARLRIPYSISVSSIKNPQYTDNKKSIQFLIDQLDKIFQALLKIDTGTGAAQLNNPYFLDAQNIAKNSEALKKLLGQSTVGLTLTLPATANQGSKVNISGKIEKANSDQQCVFYVGDGVGTIWKKEMKTSTNCAIEWQTYKKGENSSYPDGTYIGWHTVLLTVDSISKPVLPESIDTNLVMMGDNGQTITKLDNLLGKNNYISKMINVCGSGGCSAVSNLIISIRTQEQGASEETSTKAVKQWGKVNISAKVTATSSTDVGKKCFIYIGDGNGIMFNKTTAGLDLDTTNSCSYSWQTQAGQPNGTQLGEHKILAVYGNDKEIVMPASFDASTTPTGWDKLPTAWDYVNVCDNDSTGTCAASTVPPGGTNGGGGEGGGGSSGGGETVTPGTMTPEELTDISGIKLGNVKDILLETITGRWLPIAIGAMAFFALIISGFTYMTSAGDPKNAEKAKNMMVRTIIGIVIALGAYAIIYTVMSILHKIGVISY